MLAPVLGPSRKKVAMPPFSTVHGGQHNTKPVTFELMLRAAFVADKICYDMLEPARKKTKQKHGDSKG